MGWEDIFESGREAASGGWDWLTTEKNGSTGIQDLLTLGGGAATAAGLFDSDPPKIGYQGKIPEYNAMQRAVTPNSDPNRMPGSYGQRYFTDMVYAGSPEEEAAQGTALGNQRAMLELGNAAQRDRYGPLLNNLGSLYNSNRAPVYEAPAGGIGNLPSGGINAAYAGPRGTRPASSLPSKNNDLMDFYQKINDDPEAWQAYLDSQTGGGSGGGSGDGSAVDPAFAAAYSALTPEQKAQFDAATPEQWANLAPTPTKSELGLTDRAPGQSYNDWYQTLPEYGPDLQKGDKYQDYTGFTRYAGTPWSQEARDLRDARDIATKGMSRETDQFYPTYIDGNGVERQYDGSTWKGPLGSSEFSRFLESEEGQQYKGAASGLFAPNPDTQAAVDWQNPVDQLRLKHMGLDQAYAEKMWPDQQTTPQSGTNNDLMDFYQKINDDPEAWQAYVDSQNSMAIGGMVNGPGDGMSDSVPAMIEGQQPAALARDEFVIPADVVGHLGNGSTNAGAKELMAMMSRIRKARTGTTAQGKQINPNNFLPS